MTAEPIPPAEEVYLELDRHRVARERSQKRASKELDAAIDAVRQALAGGLELNLAECARRGGMSKRTLYDRLPSELRRRFPTPGLDA